MTQLIRTPSRKIERISGFNPPYLNTQCGKHKYDYTTPDGRWRVEKGCTGGWEVTDTAGEYICMSCFGARHAVIVPTLTAAKAFLAEWAAV
jgi:hypothetical protein